MANIEKKWTPEGIYVRRADVCIFPPKKEKYYKVRRIGSKQGKPLEKGEGNFLDRKEAYTAGNKLVRIMRREKLSLKIKSLFK